MRCARRGAARRAGEPLQLGSGALFACDGSSRSTFTLVPVIPMQVMPVCSEPSEVRIPLSKFERDTTMYVPSGTPWLMSMYCCGRSHVYTSPQPGETPMYSGTPPGPYGVPGASSVEYALGMLQVGKL